MAKWASIKEAADYLGMHPQTIYKAIKAGSSLGQLFKRIPQTKNWRVDMMDLESFMKGDNNG